MIDSFAKLNLLDSSDITDVHHYSKLESKQLGNVGSDIAVYDFYSIDDLKYADQWPHEQFDYRINNHGFRYNETPPAVDIAVFGCSFTFGTGLPAHMLWHNILADSRNETCLNFGIPGASIKSITDVFCIVSKHIKIKKAIFLLPSNSRIQIAKTHPSEEKVDYLSAIPGHDSKLCAYYNLDTNGLYKYLPDEETMKVAKDQVYLTEYLAKNRGIDLYYSSWDPTTYELLSKMDLKHSTLLPPWWTPVELVEDKARDNYHPGPGHHKYWFNDIKELIK